MIDGFDSLTSLTGGGAMGDLGGAADSAVGDTSFGGKQIAGVSFGSPANKGLNISPLMGLGIAVAVVTAIYLLNK